MLGVVSQTTTGASLSSVQGSDRNEARLTALEKSFETLLHPHLARHLRSVTITGGLEQLPETVTRRVLGWETAGGEGGKAPSFSLSASAMSYGPTKTSRCQATQLAAHTHLSSSHTPARGYCGIHA